MKVIIQINCFNEEETLTKTIANLPRSIEGVDKIEILVVDDGSTDNTVAVARSNLVHHIVSHKTNKGLPTAINTGIQYAIDLGADIVVNTDADNQYCGEDISLLIAPIIAGKADMTYGQRPIMSIDDFSPIKKFLQLCGAWVVSMTTGLKITDAASGFRAMNKEAICKYKLLSDFASPLETLIQMTMKQVAIQVVDIRTNGFERPSRLVSSNIKYVLRSAAIIIDNVIIYRSLYIFTTMSLLSFVLSLMVTGLRVYLMNTYNYSSHFTLLIISIVGFTASIQLFFFALTTRLERATRIINEELLYLQNISRWCTLRNK